MQAQINDDDSICADKFMSG